MSKAAKEAYLNKLKDRVENTLNVVGAQVVTWAVKECPFKSGNLSHSINYATSKNQSGVNGQTTGTALKKPNDKMTLKVGTNVVYAAIQEFGGTIVPENAGALAVPIHPDAKAALIPQGGSIRNVFPDLVMIKRKSGAPLLVRVKGNQFDIMYVLLKRVTIPAHPFLRPAVLNNKQNIVAIFAKAFKNTSASVE